MCCASKQALSSCSIGPNMYPCMLSALSCLGAHSLSSLPHCICVSDTRTISGNSSVAFESFHRMVKGEYMFASATVHSNFESKSNFNGPHILHPYYLISGLYCFGLLSCLGLDNFAISMSLHEYSEEHCRI